ncbi:uncharacterized protein LOC128953413 [Oppia nitens]|uniref:uncharacterized protein LOC128953413 n=1 Tax=Oppia nitens TaxID=1686743 RepID=UPI0023D9E795|nr:uncharacterized protein LOC128953413 [Oppia nitens]
MKQTIVDTYRKQGDLGLVVQFYNNEITWGREVIKFAQALLDGESDDQRPIDVRKFGIAVDYIGQLVQRDWLRQVIDRPVNVTGDSQHLKLEYHRLRDRTLDSLLTAIAYERQHLPELAFWVEFHTQIKDVLQTGIKQLDMDLIYLKPEPKLAKNLQVLVNSFQNVLKAMEEINCNTIVDRLLIETNNNNNINNNINDVDIETIIKQYQQLSEPEIRKLIDHNLDSIGTDIQTITGDYRKQGDLGLVVQFMDNQLTMGRPAIQFAMFVLDGEPDGRRLQDVRQFGIDVEFVAQVVHQDWLRAIGQPVVVTGDSQQLKQKYQLVQAKVYQWLQSSIAYDQQHLPELEFWLEFHKQIRDVLQTGIKQLDRDLIHLKPEPILAKNLQVLVNNFENVLKIIEDGHKH